MLEGAFRGDKHGSEVMLLAHVYVHDANVWRAVTNVALHERQRMQQQNGCIHNACQISNRPYQHLIPYSALFRQQHIGAYGKIGNCWLILQVGQSNLCIWQAPRLMVPRYDISSKYYVASACVLATVTTTEWADQSDIVADHGGDILPQVLCLLCPLVRRQAMPSRRECSGPAGCPWA